MNFKKTCKKIFWIIIVLLILVQVVPAERANPPITETIEAPEEVMSILRRSCFDCHSNETTWPWYSYVAPASWLVIDDVHSGRRHMNFSEWDICNEIKKRHLVKECGEMAEEGEMPLWYYLPLHPESALLPEDVKILVEWSKGNLK